MDKYLKYIIITIIILIGKGSYAQSQTAKLENGLIAIAYDDTKFKKAFDVYEIEELNSDNIKWSKNNNWSLHCKGFFKAPISGEVTIFVESDNYIRVEVNGSILLEDTQNKKNNSFNIKVEKGVDYPIEIFYIHDGGVSFMKFFWSWNDKEKMGIPNSALYYHPIDKDKFNRIFDNISTIDKKTFLEVPNPDPKKLPGIEVWEKKEQTLVGITFPNVPGLICDAWCYESDLELIDIIALNKGRVKLVHQYIKFPFLNLITLVTPEHGAIEFVAWIEKDKNAESALPESIGPPNLCWQLKRAENFNSNSKPYPEFVKRCFIITKNGQIQLNETDRKNIPVRRADEEVNNPPWVQNYFREDQPAPVYNPKSWAGNSDSRYSKNIIGAISKDGKYLTAITNNSSENMCQAWHDCMHNNPEWIPAKAPVNQRIWRLKIYGMENNTDELIKKVEADFPENEEMSPDEIQKIKNKSTYGSAYQTVGCVQNLPVFTSNAKDRLTYPVSWLSGNFNDFESWKVQSRETFKNTWQTLPEDIPFNPVIIDEEDRGTYIAQKIAINITADSRILTYMLIPKGKGPFPAVLLLHDHGAKFDIGKEKVIRPFNDTPYKIKSASDWTHELYGGRFIGDELAKQGYVCFAIDALNWGDRYGGGHSAQQAIASNMLHLGMSFAGLIAHEDVRSAKYLASLKSVDTNNIAAVGLSMGAFRTWQVAAMSDEIKAGIAICWMATNKGLMTYFNNQTKGHSAYPMCHPGVFNHLDYPDIASMACPKPMLFYNGKLDNLFPVPSVNDAYDKMHQIWKSQNAEENLFTKLWMAEHVFNKQMQDEAFSWLDNIFNK